LSLHGEVRSTETGFAKNRASNKVCPYFRELMVVKISIHNFYELHLGAFLLEVAFSFALKGRVE
jgi:hypothetical protein